jgi:hypothetical protein
MKTIAQILNDAADILASSPQVWGKGSYALDTDGNPTIFSDQDAVCFCAAGAIARASNSANLKSSIYIPHIPAVQAFAEYINPNNSTGRVGIIADWNDAPERTREEVIAELRAAATKQEVSV